MDWQSIRKSEKSAKRVAATDTVVLTYEGLFVTATDLESRVNPPQYGANRLGFGPDGAFPAQFVIKRVVDTVVLRKQRFTDGR